MNINDFIISKIKILVNELPWISCVYEHKSESNVYFVRVSPEETHRNNDRYNELLSLIYLEFLKNYPGESLCFITEDSPISLDHPIYVSESPVLTSINFDSLSLPGAVLFEQYLPVIPDTNLSFGADYSVPVFVFDKYDFVISELDITMSNVSEEGIEKYVELIEISYATAA